MIRVELPYHLCTLAKVQGEVRLDVAAPATQRSVLDALETAYPTLQGTIRDHVTKERRAFLRFFACEMDLSHEPPDAPLPDAVAKGAEPFLIIGAISGGSTAKKPATIDEYLEGVEEEKRAALERLRKIIRSAAPAAEECISYQLPSFRLNGMLVGFGAATHHCAFYPMSGSAVKHHEEELKNYSTSKATIHFQPDRPLPVALVKKIVKYRIEENARRRAKTKKPKSDR